MCVYMCSGHFRKNSFICVVVSHVINQLLYLKNEILVAVKLFIVCIQLGLLLNQLFVGHLQNMFQSMSHNVCTTLFVVSSPRSD